MTKFAVPDMSCGHCARTIETAIHALDPQASVTCDLDMGEVAIDSKAATEKLIAALATAGYPATALAG